ncbi:hypothetical protein [Streptomyces sp. NPDC088801]|uniref:hypothetical protein n=1 Tax=Streptomyces sp. NPDC088801 TaxID=3365903 RepID=UPI0037F50F8A
MLLRRRSTRMLAAVDDNGGTSDGSSPLDETVRDGVTELAAPRLLVVVRARGRFAHGQFVQRPDAVAA